jgi:hypothetical protein
MVTLLVTSFAVAWSQALSAGTLTLCSSEGPRRARRDCDPEGATAAMYPPSIRAIRDALDEVPGALRLEPQPEDAGAGGDPGSPIWISDPNTDGWAVDSPSVPDDDTEEGAIDEPVVVFEVPPSVTDADLRHALGEDRIGELHRLHQLRGVDALGWYLTFHQLHSQYGVHITLEGVVWLAVEFFGTLNVSLARKLELAFHAILRHELFHFEADCMIANWELTNGVELYWSSRRYRNAQGYIELEEGLANAYMLRGFKHPTRLLANSPGAYAALRKFTLLQGAGYKEGPRLVGSRTSYLSGCRDLAASYREAAAHGTWSVPAAFDSVMLYPSPTKIDWTRCPILVYDKAGVFESLGIRPAYFQSVTGIEETERFLRAFRGLDRSIQRRWELSKDGLSRSTALKSLDFKQWSKEGPDVYSVFKPALACSRCWRRLAARDSRARARASLVDFV